MRNGNLEYSQFSLYNYKKHLLSEKITNNLKLLDSLGTLRKLHVYCTLNTLKVIFRWYKFSLEHLNLLTKCKFCWSIDTSLDMKYV